jgi:hypothetical protein
MPTYNYECKDCHAKALKKLKCEALTAEQYGAMTVFETCHAIKPSPAELAEAKICPRCQGSNCERTFHGETGIGYIRGYGFLDRVGANRDMQIHTLLNDDPYSEYRVDGEKDDIQARIKRQGKKGGKKKHYVPTSNKEMEKAVAKAFYTQDKTGDK